MFFIVYYIDFFIVFIDMLLDVKRVVNFVLFKKFNLLFYEKKLQKTFD